MPFDFASALMVGLIGVVVWAVPPGQSRGGAGIGFSAASILVGAARVWGDARLGLDVAACLLFAVVVLTLGAEVVRRRCWPAGAFAVALAVITGVGAYQRADKLAAILESPPPLQPDVRYYQQQALRTANPFAAGQKSPLWSALHAPLVRHLSDPDAAIRWWSWWFGIVMIPVAAYGVGRLFEPVAGVLVGGELAVNAVMVDRCTQGLREELGVCLWMVVLMLLFGGRKRGPSPPGDHAGDRRQPSASDPLSARPAVKHPVEGRRDAHPAGFSWIRVLAAGVTAGTLLLLRNTDAPILMLLVVYALVRTRTARLRVLAGTILPLALVAPFYVNQWRAYGDAFYLEKRDARYHANFEFIGRTPPAGLSMPTPEEFDRDLYAGEPLSPAAYLFKYHPPGQIISYQLIGAKRVLLGEPFSAEVSVWMRWVCAAGLVCTLLIPRLRFAAFFWAGSVFGIRAHLIAAMGFFEERLLLPVYVIWLAAGWWLLVSMVRAGCGQWLAFSRSADTTRPTSPSP